MSCSGSALAGLQRRPEDHQAEDPEPGLEERPRQEVSGADGDPEGVAGGLP